MQDVTSTLMRYLDAKQHLWNSYFLGQVQNLHDCEPLDSFEIIDQRLFYALVCHPLKIKLPDDFLFSRDTVSAIVAEPKKYVTELPMMFASKLTSGSRRWKSKEIYPSTGMTLRFIEFFQWDKYGFLSSSMVRCDLEFDSEHSKPADQEALVELHHIDFVLVDRSKKRRLDPTVG